MKILHTSDWHLGRSLYRRNRYEEFEAFLDWLVCTIEEQEVSVLLIAGDVFDTSTPSNRAQELYYRFLFRASMSCCRHIVVVGGNHDSPSFLDAPRTLLKALQVHVVGAACSDPEDEVLVLKDAGGAPELIVCAVPYLRDRDLRTAEAGESAEEKDSRRAEGIRAHYREAVRIAEEKRRALGGDLPLIATGHLFTAGGQTVDGDGVRELYVGALSHVTADAFPETIDYLALGHLHIPQKTGGADTRRYSGSPIPMGFGEAKQEKSVCLLETSGRTVSVSLIPVPVFRKLETIRGDWATITARLTALASEKEPMWLEIEYDGSEWIGNLRDRIDEAVADSALEVLRVRNNRITEQVLERSAVDETLDDLDVRDVFARCLDAYDVPEDQREELKSTYSEVLLSLQEQDKRAE